MKPKIITVRLNIITLLVVMGVILMPSISAFSIFFFDREVQINLPLQEIVEEGIPAPPQQKEEKPEVVFIEEIQQLNQIKDVQLFLKELDISTLGLEDTGMGNQYTVYISPDGTISHAVRGFDNPEYIVKGNEGYIQKKLDEWDIEAIKNHLQVPFSLKLKIILTRWF